MIAVRLDVDVATLLVAARGGTPGAFDRLIATCRPVIERQARRSAWRSSDVDDIVQEVYIRLFEHASTIREPRSLLSWLTMVTRRAAAQAGRRGARLVPTALDDERPSPASTEDQAMSTYERRRGHRRSSRGARATRHRGSASPPAAHRRQHPLLPRCQRASSPPRRQPRSDASASAPATAGGPGGASPASGRLTATRAG